jgi:hypothetical protein
LAARREAEARAEQALIAAEVAVAAAEAAIAYRQEEEDIEILLLAA